MLIYIYARDLPLRLRGAELALPAARPARSLKTILVKGLPMGLQMIVITLLGAGACSAWSTAKGVDT